MQQVGGERLVGERARAHRARGLVDEPEGRQWSAHERGGRARDRLQYPARVERRGHGLTHPGERAEPLEIALQQLPGSREDRGHHGMQSWQEACRGSQEVPWPMRSRTCAAIDDVRAAMPRGGVPFRGTRLPASGCLRAAGRGWRSRIGPYVIVCGATGGSADAPPSRNSSSIASISTLEENGFASTFAAPMSLAMWR